MSLAALLRPNLLYSPRPRSANDALPGPRTNPIGARHPMQPAKINTSSKSGLPRDPEQWTDDDLATCARKHFRLGRTAPLLTLIDEFRITPAALWYLQTDEEELSRLTNDDTPLKEQVIDLALHIRPAVSPTSPRRMNAMELAVILDIPAPAPPPPQPPEEPAAEEEEDDDALAQSVVSDWALDEQPGEPQEQPAEQAQAPETYATEEDAPFPPAGGALGLDTTGGQQAEPAVEQAQEQTETMAQAEDLIDLGEDETTSDLGTSVPISESHAEPDAAAESTAPGTQTREASAPAEDAPFTDDEDSAEDQRSVPVFDEVGSGAHGQDDVESIEPSRTGTPGAEDVALDVDDGSSATAQLEREPETQTQTHAEEPRRDDPAPSPSHEEHGSSHEQPQLQTEVEETSTVVPESPAHEDVVGTGEEPPEPEAVSHKPLVDKQISDETRQAAARIAVAEAPRQGAEKDEEREAEPSADSCQSAAPDVQAGGDSAPAPADSAGSSEALERTDDSGEDGAEDDQSVARQDEEDEADEHQEFHEGTANLETETETERREEPEPTQDVADKSQPSEQAHASVETASSEEASQTPEEMSQSPAQESQPPAEASQPSAEETQPSSSHGEETPTEGKESETAEPEAQIVDETSGTQESVIATPSDATSSGASGVDDKDGEPQSTAIAEVERVEGEHTTTTTPLATSAASPGADTPSGESSSVAAESNAQHTSSGMDEPRRAFGGQASSSSSTSTPLPATISTSLSFGAASPSSNKFSMGPSFGGAFSFSPSPTTSPFSQVDSGSGVSMTPPIEKTQDAAVGATTDSTNALEQPPAAMEHGSHVTPPEGNGASGGEATPSSEDPPRSTVEESIEDAMRSSFFQDQDESPAGHADLAQVDAQTAADATARENPGDSDDKTENDGDAPVVVSPVVPKAALAESEQDSGRGEGTSQDAEKHTEGGVVEPGWETVGKVEATPATGQEGETPAITPQEPGTPAEEQEEAEEEGGDSDDDAEGGSEGEKGKNGGGGGGGGKRKRKKGPGSKKKSKGKKKK